MLFGKAEPGKSHGFLAFFSNYSSQKFGACRPVVNRNTYSLRLWFAHSEGHAHSAVLVALCRRSVGSQVCGRNAHDNPRGAVRVYDALLDFLVWSDLGTSLNGCTPGPACTFELTAHAIKALTNPGVQDSKGLQLQLHFFFGIEVDSCRDRPQSRIFPSSLPTLRFRKGLKGMSSDSEVDTALEQVPQWWSTDLPGFHLQKSLELWQTEPI